MAKYISKSDSETKEIAARLAKESKNNIFALTGDLGAGKTIFVQGFTKELGIKDKITSPTFVLIRQHPIPNTTKILYHIDLYRLDRINNLQVLGLEEILSNQNNIVLIEWADKIRDLLPKSFVKIEILKKGDEERIISIS